MYARASLTSPSSGGAVSRFPACFAGQVEPWFGTEYSWNPIREELLQSWEACGRNPRFRLPNANPFIATVSASALARRSGRGSWGGGFAAHSTGVVFLAEGSEWLTPVPCFRR